MNENQFLKKNSKLIRYTQIPSCLLKSNLNSTTLIIYSVLLGRAMLSLKNGWTDEFGNVFIRYKNSSLAQDVGKSVSTVKSALKELEANNLIVRRRVDATTKNIFVKVPMECVIEDKLTAYEPENKPGRSQKTGFTVADKSPTNKYKDTNNISNKYCKRGGESF